ncbi:MAG: hypothetical protein KDK70_35045, partial [Myxococcales bacterium]|nr:hypothetical protein [Myxococcales bacterium]
MPSFGWRGCLGVLAAGVVGCRGGAVVSPPPADDAVQADGAAPEGDPPMSKVSKAGEASEA